MYFVQEMGFRGFTRAREGDDIGGNSAGNCVDLILRGLLITALNFFCSSMHRFLFDDRQEEQRPE